MKSATRKDLSREIRRSWARFVSIFAIVLLGVAFFAGIKATAPDMKHTADQYYDEYNMMDIRVMSTLGLTEGDIESIRSIDSIEQVSPGYFADAVCTIASTEYVFRLHSMKLSKQDNPINQVKVTRGRLPERSGECLMEEQKYLDLGLRVGDTVRVSSGKDAPITEETLKTDEFTIVGFAVTPYYLCYEKGASDVGSGKVSFFLMVPEEDFAYPVYTEALVTVKGAMALNTYGAAYDGLVERTIVALENMGVDRSGIRLGEIKGMALEKLAEAKKEYDRNKKEYDDTMLESEKELNDAQTKLNKAEATLATEKENYETTTAMARDQINANKKQLAEGERDYRNGVQQYNDAKAKYGDELAQLDGTMQQINSLRANASAQSATLEQQLQNPDLTEDERADRTELLGMYKQLLSLSDESLSSANDLNDYGQKQMKDSERQLKDARSQLDQGHAQVAAAEAQLAQGEIDAKEKFENAQKEIDEGWAEYRKGLREYEEGKKKGAEELAAGNEKIIRAENDIERISSPQWYVLGRDSLFSFVDYGLTAERIDAIAKVFPVFFFLVAALVCLTTMTRMVDEQRGNIGTYKALGYANGAIAAKYVIYAAIASVLGAAAGLAVGMNVFPQVIYQSWSMKYTLPPLMGIRQIPLMVLSLVMGVSVTTLTAFMACYRELKETPSLLMRPKAPKAGRKVLLEYLTFLWRRLSFSQKVTIRNIFRYKKRFFMTIIGIAGCTALLLAGFGLSNSIGQVVSRQFQEIFTYDLNVRYTAGCAEEDRSRVMEGLTANPAVKSFTTGSELNAKAKSGGEDIAVTLVVPSDAALLNRYVTLRTSTGHDSIPLGARGVIVTEKLAKELGCGVGDAIELDNGDGARKKVEITGIAENYIFHYAYMSPEAYREVYRLDPKVNMLMIQLHETSPQAENDLASALIADESVASVTFYSAVAATFTETVKSLNSIVVVIILCAGMLAFVVLYNLTNINISERIREIATIKVLGFFNREVSSYVFRENILLTVTGAAIGLALGILLHRYIMVSIEQEGIMFGNYIENLSYAYSFLITMGFAGLVILFMGRRLKMIPMVESLKSIE